MPDMRKITLEKFKLYVPSIEVAKQIFTEALGLEIIKEKASEDKGDSISFKLSEYTKLFCLEHIPSGRKLDAFSNSINLFATKKHIEHAYNSLKKTNLDIKISELDIEGKKKLMLHIVTKSPSTFISVAEFTK